MKRMTRLELACNLTLVGVLVATAVHILVITLNLLGVTNFALPNNFNYIFAYILTIICLALYILGFFVTRLKRIIFPEWLRILFYVAFFLFTNVYYIFGLHTNLIGIIIFYAYIAFLINIVSVSVFYNTQKDEKNRLKASNKFISISVFCYSVAITTFVQFVIALAKVILFKTGSTTTMLVYVVSTASMLIVSIALALIFFLSLEKSKKFINACLVKYTVRRVVKKSVKED